MDRNYEKWYLEKIIIFYNDSAIKINISAEDSPCIIQLSSNITNVDVILKGQSYTVNNLTILY